MHAAGTSNAVVVKDELVAAVLVKIIFAMLLVFCVAPLSCNCPCGQGCIYDYHPS
jgi:hypothetical protein